MIDPQRLQFGLAEALDRPISGIELTPKIILLRLGMTFMLTLILSQLYRYTNREKRDSHVMMHSMVYIGTILSGAMMIIGTNLATAFGLLGAVSIIRFRTIVENSVDMSFIFLSIVIGISSGLGLFVHALVISVFVGTAMFLLNFVYKKKHPPNPNAVRLVVSVKRKVFQSREVTSLLEELGSEASLKSLQTKNKTVVLDFEMPVTEDSARNLRIMLDDLTAMDDSVRVKISKISARDFSNAGEDLQSVWLSGKKAPLSLDSKD